MNYSITITIPPPAVSQLNEENAQVVFVMHAQPMSGMSLPVAWLSLQPMENMQVSWEQHYSFYASSRSPQPGEVIVVNTMSESVSPGGMLVYENGTFMPEQQGTPGSYSVLNQSGGMCALGLAVPASADGMFLQPLPFSIVEVGNNEPVEFNAAMQVFVFVQPNVMNSQVLQMMPQDACEVNFGGSPNANLTFSLETGSFQQN